MLRPEEFAILPWGCWDKSIATPGDRHVLEEIKACGFNLAGFINPEHFDLVEAAGLQGIVWDPSIHVEGDAEADLEEAEIMRRVSDVVNRVSRPGAVFGYYLRDEPRAVLYPELAKWAAAVRKAHAQALPYVNLHPNYANSQQLGASTYEEYLEDYVRIVQPPFISYDHYALFEDGTLREGYFPNLEMVRKVARKHNLPFWNIVLSNAHFHYAEPTDAGLRFQVYTTLAYGARGISYFTYSAPPAGNFRLAPLDQFGHKTATWERLRSVNLQIHALGPTYIQFKSVHVFHYPDVPEGCSDMQTSRFLSDVSGGSLLIGEFEGVDGQPCVLVVNKDLHRSTPFQVTFKAPGQRMQVNAYNGKTQAWGAEDGWLAAGQGMLICLGR